MYKFCFTIKSWIYLFFKLINTISFLQYIVLTTERHNGQLIKQEQSINLLSTVSIFDRETIVGKLEFIDLYDNNCLKQSKHVLWLQLKLTNIS